MAESFSVKRGLAGMFHWKSDKKGDETSKEEVSEPEIPKEETPQPETSKLEIPEQETPEQETLKPDKKKNGHRRHRSLVTASELPIPSSGDELTEDEQTKTLEDEKEKSKSRFRRSLTFRRSKKKKKQRQEEKEKQEPLPIEILLTPPVVDNLNAEEIVPQLVSQDDGSPDVGVEGVIDAMGENIAVPDVSTEIQEFQSVVSDKIEPDGDELMEVIKKVESLQNLQDKIGVPSTGTYLEVHAMFKGLGLNTDNFLLASSISSLLQYEMSVCAYGFGLVKLDVLWNSLLNRAQQAKEATRQVLVYFIRPLIKKYPHYFITAIKQRKMIEKAQKKIEAAKPIEETLL